MSGQCRHAANHRRVAKWTKNVDLFSHDYIFIPVHDHLHWSLVVVCHPGNVGPFHPEKSDDPHCGDLRLLAAHQRRGPWRRRGTPCVLHLDSMSAAGGHRTGER